MTKAAEVLQSPRSDESGHSWSGTVLLWDEQALFLGRAADTSLHESPAIKICVALGDDFHLRINDDQPWQPYSSAIIAPGQLHAIDGRQNEMAMLVLVPEAALAQPLNPLFTHSGITGISPKVNAALRTLFANLSSDAYTSVSNETVCYQMMELIVAEMGNTAESVMDERVARSIEWIRSGREAGVTVKEIAAGVDLSESRFSHLFTENVRVPVRRYLLWLRLRDAIHALARGVSLTDSAYDAGFADSSHLTRTFRGMLGITPSALIKESSLTSFLR